MLSAGAAGVVGNRADAGLMRLVRRPDPDFVDRIARLASGASDVAVDRAAFSRWLGDQRTFDLLSRLAARPGASGDAGLREFAEEYASELLETAEDFQIVAGDESVDPQAKVAELIACTLLVLWEESDPVQRPLFILLGDTTALRQGQEQLLGLVQSLMNANSGRGETVRSGTADSEAQLERAAGAVSGSLPAPPPPELFCARPALHRRVLDLVKLDNGGRAPVLAMVGMGGSGKTLLAQAIADDEEVKAGFPDGVLWLDVGDTPEAVCQATVLAALGGTVFGESVAAGKTALRQRLSGARCLMILDDVTRAVQVTALDVLGLGSALLITTRDQNTLPHGTRICPVGAFELADPSERDDALSMLARYAGGALELPRPAAEEVIVRCGGLPLALATCGAMASGGYPWASIVTLLREADLGALQVAFRDYPHPSLLAAIAVGANALDEHSLSLYEQLAVFSTRGPVPVAAAARLWAPHGLDADRALRTIIFLAHRSLLTYRPDDATFLLHDLQYDYASWRLGQRLTGVHGGLADTYLATWGGLEDGLPGLRTPSTAAMDDGYPLRHLTSHLSRGGRSAELDRLLAIEDRGNEHHAVNAWFAAHDRSGEIVNYINDLLRARSSSMVATDQAISAHRLGASLGMEIRYSLMAASIASRTRQISTELLKRLIAADMWSPGRGLDHAQRLTDPFSRLEALATVYPYLPVADQPATIDQALAAATAIDGDYTRAEGLQLLVPHLTPEQREAIIRGAHLPNDLLAKALPTAVEADTPGTEAPAGVPPRLAAELRNDAIKARTAVTDIQYRLKILARGFPYLPADLREEMLAEALTVASALTSPDERARALAKLAPLLPPSQRTAVMAHALAVISSIVGDYWRSEALAAVAYAVPPKLHADALAIIRSFWHGESREVALSSLAPYLSPEMAEVAYEIAADIAGGQARASALTVLADRVHPGRQRQVLAQALASANAIPFDESSIAALAALARHLPQDEKNAVISEALDATRLIPSAVSRANALVLLAPLLPPELMADALAETSRIEYDGCRAQTMQALAPRLSPGLLTEALASCRSIKSNETRAEALASLAPYLPPAERAQAAAEALDAAGLSHNGTSRSKAMAALGALLPPELLPRAFAIATAMTHGRSSVLSDLAPYLSSEQADDALLAASYAPGDHRHQDVLISLAPYMSSEQLTLALEVAAAISNNWAKSEVYAALLPYVTESERPGLLAHVLETTSRNIAFGGSRAEDFAALVPYIPESQRSGIVADALARTVDLSDGGTAWALAVLAPYLPQNLLPKALSVAFGISDWESRAECLRVLARYLPSALMANAVSRACATSGDARRAKALAALAPHLGPELLVKAISANPDGHADLVIAIMSRGASDLHPFGGDQILVNLVRRSIDETTRNTCLGSITALAPAIAAIGGVNAVRECVKTISDVHRWWPLSEGTSRRKCFEEIPALIANRALIALTECSASIP